MNGGNTKERGKSRTGTSQIRPTRRTGTPRVAIYAALLVAALIALPAGTADPILQDDGAAPPASGIFYQTLLGTDQTIRNCGPDGGLHQFYRVVDVQPGNNFEVVVMESLSGTDIRVAFNAQIPRTYEGVNVRLITDRTVEKVFDHAMTGSCGVWFTNPDRLSYTVEVDFFGQDITIVHNDGHSVSFTVKATGGASFSVKPWKLFEVNIGAELSGTVDYWQESTTTTNGFLKSFRQTYQAPPTGPIEEIPTHTISHPPEPTDHIPDTTSYYHLLAMCVQSVEMTDSNDLCGMQSE